WFWLRVMFALGGFAVLYFRVGDLLDAFAPFDLNRPPNLLTGLHLHLMKADAPRCFAALDRAHVEYQRAPVRPIEDGCGYLDAAILTGSAISHGGPLLIRCPALVSLLSWEQHVVMPAARQYLGQGVAAVRHYGTYSCRNINHEPNAKRSQHATANAIDIAGFQTEDATRINIAKDWTEDGPHGKFLRAIRNGSCRTFDLVLSPDYNGLHRDHFHFDMGGGNACR
ncbi:MAG TPA: extensin family protein, partial [Xanthobacteraceae bacterium]|nr:extensin family protein [Xanthobacteraceae bacterium]